MPCNTKKHMMKDKQLSKGIMVEMEHKGLMKWSDAYEKKHGRKPDDKAIAEHIAKAHLKEDKNYYTKLIKAKL